MKRTLRVLFLAVLAMALMASVAMAKVTSVDVQSFDVKLTVGGQSQTLTPKGTSTDVSTDVVAVSADKEVIITFAFNNTAKNNVSVDSYDFEVTFDPTSSTTYFNVSGDKTKISGDKAFTVKLSDDAGVAVPETKISFKVTSRGTPLFTYTIKVKVDAAGSTTPTGDKPTIEFLNIDDARSFTLYMSGDVAATNGSKSFDVVVLISGDDEGLYTPDLVISDDGSYADYFEYTFKENSDYDTSDYDDEGAVAYTVTLTPVSLDKTGTTYEFYVALMSDDEETEVAKTETATMTVAILDSSDGKATSNWELNVTPSATSVTLSYYQEKDVTLTIEPSGVTPTVTFDAVTGLTITEKTSAAATTAAANTKTYTIKAGKTSGDFEVVFNVSATSGDTQTASADVDVTVKFDKNVKPAKPTFMTKADFLKLFPGYSNAWWLDFFAGPTELKDAFKNQAVVVWVSRATGPVKRSTTRDKANGWKLYFLKPAGSEYSSRFYVQQWVGALKPGEVSVADAASTTSDDLIIDPVSGDIAIYFTNVDNMKPVLDKGDNDVESSYVLEAYEDEGSTTEADPETAGAITGEKEEGSTGVLGNSSGGCDAGFGAMALALAATLFLGKKRS